MGSRTIKCRILSLSLVLIIVGVITLGLSIYYEHEGYRAIPPYIISYIASAAFIVTGIIGLMVLRSVKFLEAFIIALSITIVLKLVVIFWMLSDISTARLILSIVSAVIAVSLISPSLFKNSYLGCALARLY